MQRLILSIFLILRSLAQECIDDSCFPNNINESTEFSTTSTMLSSTDPVPSTTETSTTSTTAPTPTLPPAIAPKPSTAVCMCDLTVNQCDINCCCDTECSENIRQIFTHCVDSRKASDPMTCYSSDFLFRKPSSVMQKEKDGMFCLVRDNLAHKKLYPSVPPVDSVEEFNRLKRVWGKLTHSMHTTISEAFDGQTYKEGSTVWALQKKTFVPLQMASTVYGDLCLGSKPVKFLQDAESSCMLKLPRQQPYCSQAVEQFVQKISNLRLISNPASINMSDLTSSIDNCLTIEACLPFTTFYCSTPNSCKKTLKLSSLIKPTTCKTFGLEVNMLISHNGSEGIQIAEAYVHLRNNSELKTKVKFLWTGDPVESYERSGNPGYITGKPVLSGRKLTLLSNDSSAKREAIEMTVDPAGWLTIMGNQADKCTPNKRKNVLFNENVRQSCFLKVEKKYFSKAGCVELQKLIYDVLLNESLANFSSSVNLYVGQFGASRVEVISDWLQVIVDHFDLVSTKPTFVNTTGRLACKGLFTQLLVDIAFAKVGSFYDPQAKINGILYRFGSSREVSVICNNLVCGTDDWKVKLNTEVHFMDLTSPAVAEYAQPPGLEIKFPHDFFYPFFAGGSANVNGLSWALICAVFLKVLVVR